ncbi:MAG: DUF975 family protein [Firmicutes bacterium]|nr:DUF975 family protein [Bacillota bacterium]
MNENKIVYEPSALIKRIARDTLQGHWKEVIIACFIYLLLTDFVSTLFDSIFPMYRTFELGGQYFQYNASFVGSLYSVVLLGAFSYGIALFMLTFFRTRKTNNTLLFEGFSLLGKCILLNLVMTVFIILWGLLFVIPGIIAAIRYSQAFYILVDHPDYSVMQCINESKVRMQGNKSKYFCLELSFIGWFILVGLIQSGLNLTGSGFVSVVISGLLSLIPMAILEAYLLTANTVFYELLVGNLAVVDRNAQNEPVRMVNADYQVHEEDVKEDPYAAPENEESFNYAPRHEEDFGSPKEDDFGSPRKEDDSF